MLSTLQNKSGPYNAPIRVLVCAVKEPYTYGDDKKLMNFSVADSQSFCKAVCFDQSKFPNIVENNGIVLNNIIVKSKEIIITKQSRVYRTSRVEVPNAIKEEARKLLFPPEAQIVSILQAKQSPKKTMTSIQGRIINEGLKMTVQSKNKDCEVKTITVSDNSESVKVSLWRDMANTDINLGEFISIKNVVINEYDNEVNLTTTQHSLIKRTGVPEIQREVVILGINVEENQTEIITENEGTFVVPDDLFNHVNGQIEEFPLTMNILTRGRQVLEIVN